ncbi:TIGR02594 family protein [Tenacibaculum sp. 190524A02b]|uniref:TIGR02594 family protein n=1 Tax=Tenacibaculum vairaonense TaxID=3137860 RepID=UPI0031FAB2BC
MNKILEIALSQIGIKEQAGEQDNPEVLKYFDEIGFNGRKLHDETAWCSAFANWVAKTAGMQFTGKLNARSWLKVGREVTSPQMGDVVVLWRESPNSWKGHVGFFIRKTNRHIYILGGNQRNSVCIIAYPINRLLQFRRL